MCGLSDGDEGGRPLAACVVTKSFYVISLVLVFCCMLPACWSDTGGGTNAVVVMLASFVMNWLLFNLVVTLIIL